MDGSDASRLSELESPVEGSRATYPLCTAEGEAEESPAEPFDWRVRVVVNENLSDQEKAALVDSETELTEVRNLDEAILPSLLEASRTAQEGRVAVDLRILRNIAEIRRLQVEHSDLKTWVLVSEAQPEADPEALVAETVRQLTGVLSGCRVLEIRQGVGESFKSLWSRLNVARLMAHESSLRGLPDPIRGAEFFEQLGQRLAEH